MPWGYFSVAGSGPHRRGDVFGGHVGEGLAARSPDRRLGASRGVPGNPERDLELVCGGRKGAIRVSCVRARRLAKQRFGKGVKIAFGGKASAGRAPLADVVPELALALTPVLGSMFSLSSSKMKKSADSCSVLVSFEPGAFPPP